MPIDIAAPEIERQKDAIVDQLSRSHLMKTDSDDVPLYAMRNTLARLPEYAYIKDRKPYVDSGRLKFDIGK